MELFIDFDDEILHRYKNRNSTLLFTVYWSHKGEYYPDKDWLDFGTDIISGWAYELGVKLKKRDLISNIVQWFTNKRHKRLSDRIVLDFMDGPYQVRLFPIEGSKNVEIRFRNDDKIWVSSYEEILIQMLKATDKMIQKFDDVNFVSDKESAERTKLEIESLLEELNKQT